MIDNVEKYRNYANNIKRLMILSGLWPKTNPTVRLISVFLDLLVQIGMILGVLNFCVHHITNITILTKGMSWVLSFSSTALKILIFLLYRDDLNSLDNNLTVIYEEDMKSPKNQSRLLKNIWIYALFYYTQVTCAIFGIGIYGIIPIIAWAKYGKYRRVFPVIYPFDYQSGGPVHWILYFFELLAGFYFGTVAASVDCGFGMYSLQMCGELRVLTEEFKNLKAGDGWRERVKKCVRKHYLILDSKKKLEKLYGLVAIWNAVVSAVVICAIVFQFTEALKIKIAPMSIAMLIFYVAGKFVQVFSYAWCGSAVSAESELCLDAIYKSDWTNFNATSFKKDLLIMMIQKPIVLTAKGCMLIQLDMFVTIAKTSVSYFCLLQTLNGNS